MLGLFFGFKGRINRATYWLGNLAIGLFGFFGIMLGLTLAGSGGWDKTTEGAMRIMATAGLTVGPVMIAMSWASLALQVKRFHDRGRSGLLTLVPMFPWMMMVMTVISGAMSGAPFEEVAGQCWLWLNILSAMGLWLFIDLGCLAGVDGPNKYGDPPRGGFGMGAGPAPGMASAGAPGAARSAASAASTAFLGNVDKAMEAAIAERARAAARPATPVTAPSPAMVASPAAVRPSAAAAPTGFGRKPAR